MLRFGRNKLRATKYVLALATFAGVNFLATGCTQQQSDNDAIRAGIRQHLISLNTLNLSAMDMDVNDVAIQGHQASAQVTFRPKTGAPAGAGMQVAYQLEKRDSGWVVVKTETAGGMIAHPATNANPHAQPAADLTHGDLPNFREMIPPANPSSGATLPPGHPPIRSASLPPAEPAKQKPE
jgi:hypothetical protein